MNRDHIEPRFLATKVVGNERIFFSGVVDSNLRRKEPRFSCIAIRFLILFGTRTSNDVFGFLLKSPIMMAPIGVLVTTDSVATDPTDFRYPG